MFKKLFPNFTFAGFVQGIYNVIAIAFIVAIASTPFSALTAWIVFVFNTVTRWLS